MVRLFYCIIISNIEMLYTTHTKRSIISRIIYSKFSILLFLAILFFAGRSTWQAYGIYKESREAKENTENSIKVLEEKKKNLEEKVFLFNTERGVEEEIRKKFQVAKDGEEIVIIVDRKNERETPIDNSGIFSKIWLKLKSWF